MEFVEEEVRPRFLLHSRAPAAATAADSSSAADPGGAAVLSKIHAVACVAAASVLLFSAFYSPLQSQTLVTLLVWFALSLLLGPFVPSSITGGDVRVGVGEPLEPPEPDPAPEEEEEPKKRGSGRRAKARRSEEPLPSVASPAVGSVPEAEKKREQRSGAAADPGNGKHAEEAVEAEERVWNEEDLEILKKQIAKHPVGTPRRWEQIAEAFRGRHGVESVIRTAKSLHERKPGAGDSFAQFLRQRKPLDKRAEAINPDLPDPAPSENGEPKGGECGDANGGGSGSWSSGEDIALLNALKVFPKDAPMRWEKIAAAVPGRSKAACMKRVTELKRDFRSLKASEA